MNVSLPEEMKAYVDRRVAAGSYQSSSEYVRELIRRDQDVQQLKDLIQVGIDSPDDGPIDEAFFQELRARAEAGSTAE